MIDLSSRSEDNEKNRDLLGRKVREVWIAYCLEVGDTKPSHIAPYDDLSEVDKEADRRIGEALFFEGIEYGQEL